MPPKAKYSKEEIIEKAVEIIVTQGYEKLTARELAAALGTSAKPIFTAFENMDDVKRGCFNFAYDRYHSFFVEGLGDNPFKQIGKIYIKFAISEPQLYKLVFLQSQSQTIPFNDYMKSLDDNYEETLGLICENCGANRAVAEEIYRHMWIYSTGIATLCATQQCSFTDDEIDRLLETAFTGIEEKLLKGEL